MMEVVMTTGAVRRVKLLSNRHHQHTTTQTFMHAGCLSCHPTNSVRALRENHITDKRLIIQSNLLHLVSK